MLRVLVQLQRSGQRNPPSAGALFWYSCRDAGFARNTAENFYGLLRYHLRPKLGYAAYRRIAST